MRGTCRAARYIRQRAARNVSIILQLRCQIYHTPCRVAEHSFEVQHIRLHAIERRLEVIKSKYERETLAQRVLRNSFASSVCNVSPRGNLTPSFSSSVSIMSYLFHGLLK